MLFGQSPILYLLSSPRVFTARVEARKRMRDFFSSHIRNKNTRRAYLEAVRQFSAFCAEIGIVDLAQVEPIHVAAFVEAQPKTQSKPTVKQRLAALRMLFDWMVVARCWPPIPRMPCAVPSISSVVAKRRCYCVVIQGRSESHVLLQHASLVCISAAPNMAFAFHRLSTVMWLRTSLFSASSSAFIMQTRRKR